MDNIVYNFQRRVKLQKNTLTDAYFCFMNKFPITWDNLYINTTKANVNITEPVKLNCFRKTVISLVTLSCNRVIRFEPASLIRAF